jgi:hypothetical protein
MIGDLWRGTWFDRDRLIRYGQLLMFAQAVAVLILLFRDRQAGDNLGITDFLGFFAAGDLAASGEPASAYDYARHLWAERRLVPSLDDYIAFFYPPMFLLVLTPLSLLGYPLAFVAWSILKSIAYAAALLTILRDRARLWPLLALPAAYLDLWAGQNGLLAAALFGFATVAIDRRPVLAGLAFGALCFKPQLAPLVAVALIAGGRWLALGSAMAAGLALAAASWIAFGTETWRAFIAYSAHAPTVFAAGGVDWGLMASPFAATRALGGDVTLAGTIQGAFTLGAAVSVGIVWRRAESLAIRSSVLISGVMIASPVLLFYDLALSGIAFAWIWEDGRLRGWWNGEKLGLLVLFLGPLLAKSLGAQTHLPVSVLVGLGLFGLALDRARNPSREKGCR